MISWYSLITTLGIGLLSVVATVAITFIRGKAVKWSRRISDPIVERLNEQLDIWIDDSINTVNKNFVDKLKEIGEWERLNGVFDKDTYKRNAAEALERCLASLKSRIPKPFKKLVSKYYDDTDLFYKNRIDERMKEHELICQRKTEELKKQAEEQNNFTPSLPTVPPYSQTAVIRY